MIDLYYWPTPNGRKISIMLEECALDYTPIAVDIGSDWQRKERSSDTAHAIMFGQNSETVYRAVDVSQDNAENQE